MTVRRRFTRWLLGQVLAAGLVMGAPAPGSADDPPPAKTEGAAAWKALVGNTIVTTSKSGAYTEFYGPDGAVLHVDSDGKSKGTWTLQGEKVCFDFPDEDDHSCVTMQVTGATGVFTDTDGSKDVFDILPGNAKNL